MYRALVQKLWAVFAFDVEPAIRALNMPGLILTKTGDDIYEQARRADALWSDVECIELPGGTNDIVDEQPADWTAAIIAFLLE